MARTELERTVQQSLFDRLIDDEPGERVEAPMTFAQSVRALKRAVHRDLETLLNTRRSPEAVGDEFPELRRSVFNYGLPDISSMSRDAPATRSRLLRFVAESIALFEPRLANVTVSLAEDNTAVRPELHFTIEALLRMDPNPEQVLFDTHLDQTSGAVAMSGGDGA